MKNNRKIAVLCSLVVISCFTYPLHSFAFPSYPSHDARYKFIPAISAQFDKNRAYCIIAELTKEEYEGRLAGSEGGKKAAQWIADQYKAYGLKPFQEDSYFQPVINYLSLFNGDNVIGYIPSNLPGCKKSIVIGAHFDHLGRSFSGKIYPGANDNASGTSVVMEMARVLSNSILLSSVNIVFVAFTGEEQGLHGSTFYAESPLFPIAEMQAMINMDMVGTGTGEWEIGSNFSQNKSYEKILKNAISYYKLKSKNADWFTRPLSDHYPFYKKRVPVVCILKDNPTNIGGYHTFEDTLDSIDQKNLEECGRFCLYNVLSLIGDYLTIPLLESLHDVPSDFYQMVVLFKEDEILKLFKTGLVYSS